MSSPTTETKADPYKDLSEDQKARVEKALAKAKTKGTEPQQESTSGEVATNGEVIEGELVTPAAEHLLLFAKEKRSRADIAKLRQRNTSYQVCEPLASDDMEALRKSVLTKGIQLPVIIDRDGNVLDGHNRVHIAIDNNLQIPALVVDLDSDAEKRALAWELNRARRQMSEEQKNELRYQMVVIEGRSASEVAKELGEGRNTTIRKARKEAERRNGDSESPDGQNESAVLPGEQKRQKVVDAIKANPGKSDRAIAEETGVSQPTVSRTRKKVNEGKQAVKKEHAKKLTVHDEFARAVAKLSKAADELVRLSRDSRAARSGAKLWEANGQELVAIDNKLVAISNKLQGKSA